MPEDIIIYESASIFFAAEQFLEKTSGYKVFAFHGQMGSGKTTFIKSLCTALKCAENTSSPTFSLINEYHAALLDTKIYHADLYRIENIEEALNIGIEDYINDAECINFIEWPEIIEGLLPADTVHVFIETVSDTQRTIRIITP
jgi:tRNA threonylcarbamoyladenosine biosynthesis protein TsaE